MAFSALLSQWFEMRQRLRNSIADRTVPSHTAVWRGGLGVFSMEAKMPETRALFVVSCPLKKFSDNPTTALLSLSVPSLHPPAPQTLSQASDMGCKK